MKTDREINKVICIGMHKTGTTTLGLALIDLGYKVLGARTDLAEILLDGNLEKALEEARPYNALQDVPWALLFKELDKKYPDSKFILTEREESKWMNSVLNHFGDSDIPLHKWIYGTGIAKGNEDIYIAKYRNHHKEVKAYFKNRPNDLLTISLSEGDGWEKLCGFLGHAIPNKNFPYANKGRHNWSAKEKMYNKLRSVLPVAMRRKILDILGIEDKRNRFHNHFENKAHREHLRMKRSKRKSKN